MCHGKKHELETESHHKAVSRQLTLSYQCIKKIILAEMKKAIRRDKRVQSCYSKFGLPPAILASPRSLLEIQNPTPDLPNHNAHFKQEH